MQFACSFYGYDRAVSTPRQRAACRARSPDPAASRRASVLALAGLGAGPVGSRGPAEHEQARGGRTGATAVDGADGRQLETQGLVERHADPDDGRSALIELTEAGRVELREDRGRREGWLAEAIEESFSDEEREVLDRAVRLLARLNEL